MKKLVVLFPLFFTLLPALAWASPPVPYSGKVAINGVNYHGSAKFVFAIRDHSGTVHWRNGVNGQDGITVNVANGLIQGNLPSEAGNHEITLKATNPYGTSPPFTLYLVAE